MAINPNAIFSAFTSISDLLNNFLAVDVVAIFDSSPDSSFQQVFETARPMKAEVKETSMVMRHPVETGTVIADNHIINPVEINMSLMVKSEDYNSAYGQMKQAFVAATLLSVQTRTGVYPNMIIADMPHVEESEIYDGVVIFLHLMEVLFVVPNSVSPLPVPANFAPRNPVDTNIIPAGQKYPSLISNSNVTAVRSIFTGLSFKGLL